VIGAHRDFTHGHVSQGAFALLNAVILFYAIAVFIGFRHSWDDIAASLRKEAAEPVSLPEQLVVDSGNVSILRQERRRSVHADASRGVDQERRRRARV